MLPPIVITAEFELRNEYELLWQLLHEGAYRIHLRKPSYNDAQLMAWLEKCPASLLPHLVVHSSSAELLQFPIAGLHYSHRLGAKVAELKYYSSGFHSITEYCNDNSPYHYAFLSPVFSSISKAGYASQAELLSPLVLTEKPRYPLVGLGGIQASTVPKAFALGFDGIAVHGYLWQDSTKAISHFKNIYQQWQLHS